MENLKKEIFSQIKNVSYSKNDCVSDHSETVGNIRNIYFDNIRFDRIRKEGFSDVTVNGLFDCCADMSDIYFNDIYNF